MTHHPPALLPTIARHAVKVWGGDRLLDRFDKPIAKAQLSTLDTSAPIGESWDAADLPEGQSFVRLPDGSEQLLHDAVTTFGEALTGTSHAHYPLLIKTLDAARDLSIQVHPGAKDLHLFDAPHIAQKDECWLILDAAPGGSILHGFKTGITRLRFEQAIANREDLSALMRRHEVTPGEVVHVPPGTVHAICAGVTLLEVQQPSDTTFRVWDYDRPGLDGHLRPLHLEQALKVLNFGPQPSILTHTTPVGDILTRHIETPYYRLSTITPHNKKTNISKHINPHQHATSLFTLDRPATLEHGATKLTIPPYSLTLCTTALSSAPLFLSDAPLVLIESLT